jgi:endoglucanase
VLVFLVLKGNPLFVFSFVDSRTRIRKEVIMSILKKTLSCAVLAALGTCALAGCGRQDTPNEAATSASPEASAAITETISESTASSEQTSSSEASGAQPAETEPAVSEAPSVDDSTPFGQHGALHVENGKLTDADGNIVQLYGMSTHGIAWFPQYINYDSFRTLRDDWNTNCIRLAMYTAEYGGYCAGGDKEQLKQLVRDGVSYATELGMYVIVDWHILSDCDPNQNKDEAIAFFREMSEAFADNDNVLYEICNEPNSGTSWDSIKSYAEEVIPVIREQKPDAVILVGTPTWSQEIDKAASSPLTFDNVMYTLHFYAGTHKDDLRNRLETCAQNNLPVFVSEFGMCDASGNGANDFDSTTKWLDLLNKYQISFCCWNLANKDESSSVFKAASTALSDWTDEDFNESGRWIRDYFRSMPRN